MAEGQGYLRAFRFSTFSIIPTMFHIHSFIHSFITSAALYKHSSLAFRGFVLREVAPKIKIHLSDPSMQRNIKTVRQLEQTFEQHCTMFKGKKQQLASQCFCKGRRRKKKNPTHTHTHKAILKHCFGEGGGQSNFRGFSLFAGDLGT
jgi:hypothetical protein